MLALLLARSRDLDAVIFSNDDMAVGGVFHCMSEGIVPKRDLALFGFNGLAIGQTLPTPLSTIRSNRFLIGKTAMERILSQPVRTGAAETIDTSFEIVEGGTDLPRFSWTVYATFVACCSAWSGVRQGGAE